MSAKDRLAVGLSVISVAFDRDGISIEGAAEHLHVDEQTVRDAIMPFTDLEYVHTSGQLLDDIGHVVTVTDDFIEVQQNWMQDLTAVTAGDASLLLAMIETAGEIAGVNTDTLKTLKRSLYAIAQLSVTEAVPQSVAMLIGAKHEGSVISARREGSDMRVALEATQYEIHEVRWTDGGWRALVIEYGEPEAPVLNIPAEKLHDITQTGLKFERKSLTMSEHVVGSRGEAVVIEYPLDHEWLLGYFNPQVLRVDNEVGRSRIQIDPGQILSRLLLRLGPSARVIEPPHLTHRGAEAASEILSMYTTRE